MTLRRRCSRHRDGAAPPAAAEPEAFLARRSDGFERCSVASAVDVPHAPVLEPGKLAMTVGDPSGRAFVGREHELRVLEGELAEAAAGRGRLVAVAGDAGIGKTRMIEELIARACVPPGRVVWGPCPEQPGAPAYWPWARALRAYATACEPEKLAAELDSSPPEIAQLLSLQHAPPDIAGSGTGASDESRFRMFDGLARFIRRATEHAALVIVLDDIHWADAATLQLLAFLARELRGMRLLLVATHRTGQMQPAGLHECLARASRRMQLRGLPREEVGRLLEVTTGDTPAPGLVAELHRITEGNPFFLQELVRMLEDEGALGRDDLVSLPAKLPAELRATIRRRFAPLAPEDRQVLELAAVVGHEFEVAYLELASGLSSERLLECLGRAVAAQLVEELPAGLGGFRFAHALIRETLYDDLAPRARSELHLRVGQALDAASNGKPEPPYGELAHHFFHAATLGDATTALEYAVRAADQARTRHAYEEAVAHLERAVELVGLIPGNEPRRLGIQLALGSAALRASETAKARAAYEQAARAATRVGDADALAQAALGYWEAREPTGIVDSTEVRLLEAALDAVGSVDSAVRARLLVALSRALLAEPDPTRRRALLEEGLQVARRVGDPEALGTALLGKHFALLGPTGLDRRLAVIAEAVELAERAHARTITAWSRTLLVHDLLESCNVPAAEREIENLALAAEATRLPLHRWAVAMLRAGIAISSGRVEEGARLAARALELPRDAKDPTILQMYCTQLFVARREAGSLGPSLEQSITHFVEAYRGMHSWRCVLALMHADAGRTEAAHLLLDRIGRRGFADVPRDVHFFPALAWLAETTHILDDRERATQLYPMLLPYAERNVVASWWSPAYLGSMARYLGLLAATAGHADDAAGHFEQAIAANARMGARGWLAHTRADYARVLLDRNGPGDREHTVRLLAEARDAADELGLTRLRARLATLQPLLPTRESAPSHTAILRQHGRQWTVGIGPQTIGLKDGPGLAYLSALVREPGREFHVLDLIAGPGPSAGRQAMDLGDAGELLDATARNAYKRRLADLEAELDEAQRFNDAGRVARARHEAEFLTGELARAVGLGGRSRRASAASERARVNVTKVLGRTIEKIAAGSPALGQHLSAAVRRGLYCSYAPDPRMPFRWEL